MADTSPGWPADDPVALRQWLGSGGASELGFSQDSWATLVYACTFGIWHGRDPAERRAYRDTALAAIESGRRLGALDEGYYTEQAIYIRMSYLRNSAEDDSWRRAEMAEVADIFLAWIPMSLAEARDASARWRDRSRREILSLRKTKVLLGLMEPGASYLTGRREQVVREWLSLVPQLP
ncbi:MAG: hypothetical protein ABSB59_39235 [Streptosporangiaceae bacterium]|jgi:hypothetical protein